MLVISISWCLVFLRPFDQRRSVVQMMVKIHVIPMNRSDLFTNTSIVTHNQEWIVETVQLSGWTPMVWNGILPCGSYSSQGPGRWNKWINDQSSSNKAHLSRFIHSVSYFQQQLDIGSRSNWGFDGVVWCKGGSYANRESLNIITVGCWVGRSALGSDLRLPRSLITIIYNLSYRIHITV